MPLNHAMLAMNGAEVVLWIVLALLFHGKGLARRFPAMGYYVAMHALATPLLLLLLFETSQPGSFPGVLFPGDAYLYGFFAVYFVSVVLLFYICVEVFRSALEMFPGIARLATVLFRWVAVVSLAISFSSVAHLHHRPPPFEVLYSLMHSVSLLQLSVLAFLCLSLRALRLNWRDRTFGIAAGFGVLSLADFLATLWASKVASYNDPVDFVYEAMILLALAVWTAYTLLPEPARRPVLIPARSALHRWNEIAIALGHAETKVVVRQPASGFLLTDVERLIERVAARKAKDSQSESET